MESPARRDLLPGVHDAVSPPRQVFESRSVIRRARRRAALRDSFDVLFLITIDVLFLRGPESHVPFLGRYDSLAVLGFVNLAIVAHLWLARMIPRWRARRIAATWAPSEQRR